MRLSEPEDEVRDIDEVLQLILTELRETNEALSDMSSALQGDLPSIDAVYNNIDTRLYELHSALRGFGVIIIALLGIILWRLW